MRTEDSLKTNYGLDSWSKVGLDLETLGEKVHQAIFSDRAGPGSEMAEQISPEKVRNMIAEIAGTPQPGMIVQNTIV